MKRLATLLTAALVFAGSGQSLSGITHAAQQKASAGPAAGSITVLVGLGQTDVSPGSQLAFTPKYVDISVGDTVKFKDVDQLEPHTVTFGTMAELTKMANNFITPVPQKNGPPQLVIDPKGANATPGHTYAGMGIANSGILPYGKSWSLTFTAAGTYHYICVVHGTGMTGTVTVHAIPMAGKMWMVQAGDGMAAGNDKANSTVNDSFYPRHLTVHVGDMVQWIGGFHTITFGPEDTIRQLEKNLFMPMPQGSGTPKLLFNPKIAFPAGGNSYNGTGFVNSGIMALLVPPGSKAPPSYKLTFTAPGTFTYDCLVHPGMDGTITVIQ